MNNTEYWKEVNDTAECIISEITDEISTQPFSATVEQGYRAEMTYERLHETIDSHEYIIYTHNHLPILQHSPNDTYMADNIGDLDESKARP